MKQALKEYVEWFNGPCVSGSDHNLKVLLTIVFTGIGCVVCFLIGALLR